jgi:hypothetical protein
MKKVVPEVVSFVCDGCSAEQTRSYDHHLRITNVGRDFGGHAVGSSSYDKDLCGKCYTRLEDALSDLGREE